VLAEVAGRFWIRRKREPKCRSLTSSGSKPAARISSAIFGGREGGPAVPSAKAAARAAAASFGSPSPVSRAVSEPAASLYSPKLQVARRLASVSTCSVEKPRALAVSRAAERSR
jgi:hypothetical protein